MIKIEDVEVFGFRKAIMGMRNPYDSWEKSDSMWDPHCALDAGYQQCGNCPWENIECELAYYRIGTDDMELAKKLIRGGTEHRKFLRMIHVQADITAPLYWWKQADTYKVGTVSNSCSTMHTITRRQAFAADDFSIAELPFPAGWTDSLLDVLNAVLGTYKEEGWTKEEKKQIWNYLISILPSGFNQKRTLDLNYETLMTMYNQRRNHKLGEWHEFCNWIESLPYMSEFCGISKETTHE